MLTRDVVRCFRDIAYQIKEFSFTDKTMETTETVDVGITCEVQRWNKSAPPGFFPAQPVEQCRTTLKNSISAR